LRPLGAFRVLKNRPLRVAARELERPPMPPPAEIGCNANGSYIVLLEIPNSMQ